jgi:hypothetical protein
MKYLEIRPTEGSGILSDVTILACTEVEPLPFVADFLSRPLARYDGGCGETRTAGPVSLNGRRFIVQGISTARMNYKP